jgi:hypothetical protein
VTYGYAGVSVSRVQLDQTCLDTLSAHLHDCYDAAEGHTVTQVRFSRMIVFIL